MSPRSLPVRRLIGIESVGFTWSDMFGVCHSFVCLYVPRYQGYSRAVPAGGPGKLIFCWAISCSYMAILVQNLYTGEPCEGVRSLPRKTKNPKYGSEYNVYSVENVTKSALIYYQCFAGKCFVWAGKFQRKKSQKRIKRSNDVYCHSNARSSTLIAG